MLQQVSRALRAGGHPSGASDRAPLVYGVAALMVIAQLALRAWVLYPSWFFLDDYDLLRDATGSRLDSHYLLTPFSGRLMPGGRLLVWLVAQSGPVNWGLAATFTLIIQALTSAAAVWMLVTLFGARRLTLAPLALYLSSAMTVPALVWWSASLSLMPLQGVFFVAVGAWVRYLRGHRIRWLVAATAAVVVGLLFDVRAFVVLPVLGFIAVAYFASGPLRRRAATVVGENWPAAVVGTLVVFTYGTYYLHSVPVVPSRAAASLVAQIAGNMFGTAFASGVTGGPWRWAALAPPTAFADPPGWAVHLSWVLGAFVIFYGALRRRGTLRSWGLLAGYLSILLAMLVDGRGARFGSLVGLEYLYLTGAAGIVSLCVGLAFLPLLGAAEPSRPREQPLLRLWIPTGWVLALVVLVTGSGLVSTVTYAGYWHTQNPSDPYVHNLMNDLRAQGAVDLADQVVPEAVLSPLTAPDNTVRRLAPLVSDRASFPLATPRLVVVAQDGGLRKALIRPGVVSRPGPKQGCGWQVDDAGLRIPLTGRAFRFRWWIRIGYASTADSPVTVRAGASTVHTTVEAGSNSVYVSMLGSFGSVRIDGLALGVSVCVDTVEVGQPTAGGEL